MTLLHQPENTMLPKTQTFLPNLLAVVVGSLLFVMSVAFVSIPLSLGGHPGDKTAVAAPSAFHPS
jgi:hypothetical protein